MKTRQGFVSNSSSTSFCLFGISLEVDTIRDAMNKKITEDNDEDWTEFIENAMQGDLSCVSGDSDYAYIGISLNSLLSSSNNNRNLIDIKNEVLAQINSVMKDTGIDQEYSLGDLEVQEGTMYD